MVLYIKVYTRFVIKIQNPQEDIVPLTDFRNNLAKIMQRIRERKSPVLLTQSGRAAAVIMSIEAYQELISNYEAARQALDSLMELAQGEHPAFEGVRPRAKR